MSEITRTASDINSTSVSINDSDFATSDSISMPEQATAPEPSTNLGYDTPQVQTDAVMETNAGEVGNTGEGSESDSGFMGKLLIFLVIVGIIGVLYYLYKRGTFDSIINYFKGGDSGPTPEEIDLERQRLADEAQDQEQQAQEASQSEEQNNDNQDDNNQGDDNQDDNDAEDSDNKPEDETNQGGPKTPEDNKEVFNVSNNIYTYTDAEAVCKAHGADLASYEQLANAHQQGAEWCNYGWSKDQMALFPTQKESWEKLQDGPKQYRSQCGKPGINGGYFDNSNLRFGVNCYGKKPQATASEQSLIGQPFGNDQLSRENRELQTKVKKFKSELVNMTIMPHNREKWSE